MESGRDALYELAVKHGASDIEAAGFAHHINGALALLETQTHDGLHRESAMDAACQPAHAVDLGLSEEEREWIEYAIAHMRDDSEPEDLTCADALENLLHRIEGQRDVAPGVQP